MRLLHVTSLDKKYAQYGYNRKQERVGLSRKNVKITKINAHLRQF